MARGGDSDDKRDQVPRRSLRDAHDEAARLIEGNEFGREARKALIEQEGIDESYLDHLCRNVMYYYWHIQKRIAAEPDALEAAQEAVEHALGLTDWVTGLMPVIFDIVEDPYPSLKSDDILDALARVRQLAHLRAELARSSENMLGFTREKGTKGESASRVAARRFAIGLLANGIKYTNPKGRPYNDHVRKIALALFPGGDVSDRMLERGRERALLMDDRIELWLFPEVAA